MSTPLFVGSYLQVTWWANEKEEKFASNYIFFYLFRTKKINLDKFQSLKLTGIYEIYVSTSRALINHFPLLSTSRTKFYGGKKTQIYSVKFKVDKVT